MDDKEILELLSVYSDKAKVGLAPPAVSLDTVNKCREYCATDDCGCYDKYCSCPPRSGTPEERLKVLAHYSKSAVVPVLYEADYRDKEAMAICMKDLQDRCREMVFKLKEKCVDVIGFADGGCQYCARCSALDDEPCRFPEMQIQSVSGNGILMGEFLKQSGIECVVKDGHIEMYAVLLYN